MSIKAETVDGILVLHITHENLDAGNSKEFRQEMDAHLDQAQRIAVDMTGVQFVDSSGLGALLSCLRAVNNKQGAMALYGMSKPVLALFELVRMNRIFDSFATREEALAKLNE